MRALRTFGVAMLMAVGLCACDSSKSAAHSGLAAALALTPQAASAVLYTDWSALGHGNVAQQAPEFAGALVSSDLPIQSDLGFRSTDAQWEADLTLPESAPVTVLKFDPKTDLRKIADRLITFGYQQSHTNGYDLLKRSAMPTDTNRIWQIWMRAVGLDRARHLLVASGDPKMVQSVLDGGPSLGSRADVRTAVRHVGMVVGAAVSTGDAACPPVGSLTGKSATSYALAVLRQKFSALGSYSPFTVDVIGVPDAAAHTGTAALVFHDSAAARTNRQARSAAPPVVSQALGASPDALVVDSSSVDGPVLTLSLKTAGPQVLPQAVYRRSLGFDVCL